jgi:hypothetical protein
MQDRKLTIAELREKKYGIYRHQGATTHEKLVDVADTAAKATRVVAVAATAGAFVAAPTGLTAVGVSLGLVSAPFIVTAAPILTGVASGAAAIYAAASLYSRFRKKR